jgi:peptide/nickel transport system substrate-binding protein/oligopeptide transport system substrate-binding protein
MRELVQRFCRVGGWRGALLLPAVASLIACTTEGKLTPSEPAQNAPRRGGVLRLLHEAPTALDPLPSASVYESLPIGQIFEGLLTFDPALNAMPGLAATWTVSDDSRDYTFHLRPGVRFHDGTPLTADDVVFTFRRALAPGLCEVNLACPYLKVIAGAPAYIRGETTELPGVEAVDELTVRIRLDRPYLSFLQSLAMDNVMIVPRAAVERLGDEVFGQEPVGTGPFRLESWDEDVLRLAANLDHVDGPPLLDGVEIVHPAADELDLGAARFRRGEIDLVSVPTDEIDAFSREPRVRILRYHELSLSFLGLSSRFPPLDDVRVRQAVAHALDRDALTRQSPETRRLATGILPPGLPGYSPRPKALTHDPARARQLLAEAGHPGGEGLSPVVLYTTPGSSSLDRLKTKIRGDLEAVGITLEVREVRWAELDRAITEATAPAFLIGWIADLPDPDSFLRSPFETGGVANYFAFGDPVIDALLEQGARELNPVTRADLYRRIERLVLERAPIVPLYHGVEVMAVGSHVHGLDPGPMGLANLDLAGVWLTPQGSAP